MNKATTYLEIVASCPACSHDMSVEYIDEYSEPEQWSCDECEEVFEYTHPECVYDQ